MGRYVDVCFFSYYCMLLFLWSLLLVHGANTSSHSLQDPKNTMVALSKNIFTLSPQKKWNTSDQNPCHWAGVSCNASSQVIALSLPGFGLSTGSNSSTASTFFDLLCLLHSLQSLDLSNNLISAIPDSFFSNCDGLAGLKSLNLSFNTLTGFLPNVSSFASLESLDVSNNNFRGVVDTQLDRLVSLKSLNLSSNSFSGTIPTLSKSSSLEALVMSNNLFEGEIPNGTFQFENLTHLDLSQNQLSGSLPGGIERLSKLEILLLSSNNLTGDIPSNLSLIRTLSRFAANQNSFSGSIPSGITKYVKNLDLSYNKLEEDIPSNFLSSTTLESVDLTFNTLKGIIPENLSGRLFRLRLGANKLSGIIPSGIGQLSDLTYLELDANNLTGEIPWQLGKCSNLLLLNLASNGLQGMLPAELGSLSKLVVMKLQMNNLIGMIPDEFFKLVNLDTLNLSRNSLTGAIPFSIFLLQKLSTLSLEDNRLTGSIPSTIGSMKSLIELQLGHNELSGTIPRMPSSLSTALNLSSNFFSGRIPSYLGDLSQLEILDLSHNSFTGEVPASFAQLNSLTQLVLSYNKLSGILPALPKNTIFNITGNNGLVAHPPSPPSPPAFAKRSSILVIIIVVICSVVGFAFIAAVLFFLVSRFSYRLEAEVLQSAESPPHIINGSFITSNSVHRSTIDFARAMEVVGNPNNIMLKTRFSTYYKAVMPSGVSYSLKKLNWGDKIFQTGSHSRFAQELEVLGRLSNSNVMVPLAYVLTEDSAYLFYENVHKGTAFDFLHKGSESPLDWPSRYSIALGVAQGLTFLHGCTQPVLLLDFTTKSVHLKSLKEPQIGDIELCKVIDPSKSTGSLSTVAGSVGYVPPEYAYTMRVTMAGNVYSFGVILLELLTGKPPVNHGIELAKWAQSYSARLDGSDQILDSNISRTSLAVRSQMLSVLKVALSCVSFSPEARPKMRNVLRMLFNAR